jgi:uncharacterized protein (UPF0303 family)
MTADSPELAELLLQEEELQFATFGNDTAWELGCSLVEAARRDRLAVTIDIRFGDQQLFHAALPGTAANNDAWIERKNRVVRRYGHSSFYVGTKHRVGGTDLFAAESVDPREYAAHGGAFPIIVRDVGVVGTVTVSGLPQADDHRLVVETLRALLTGT